MQSPKSALLFVAILLAAPARAAEPTVTLRVGAAHADITPDPAVLNWVTGKPYGSVTDPIALHALVLDDGRTKAALIRWDLVDVSESARDEVRRVVSAALAMPAGNIMINASHNHSAPWAPAWRGGYRGNERDTWWAVRYMPAQNEFPPFKAWMEKLLAAAESAARAAAASAQVVTPSIGRVAVYEYVWNRRPRAPAWGLAETKRPAPIQYNHPDWAPDVLQGGASFGPLDRTLAVVSFVTADGKNVASLFHAACHAVSIYPSNPALDSDWPGPTSRAIAGALGGEALFLQGCTGDINPWRRGATAVAEMAAGFAKKAQLARRYAVKLTTGPLHVARRTVALPLTDEARKRVGAATVDAEVQVIACGPLAFVALPGEPMTELGLAIREKSPFPQTLVLGYSNGNGVHYVGMPGEKARGGYEAGAAGAGTDECAWLMINAAVDALREIATAAGHQMP